MSGMGLGPGGGTGSVGVHREWGQSEALLVSFLSCKVVVV